MAKQRIEFIFLVGLLLFQLIACGQDEIILEPAICINGVLMDGTISFIEELPYDFQYTRAENDDLDDIDVYHYYISDSIELQFYEFQQDIRIATLQVKCESCFTYCKDDINVSIGVTAENVMLAYNDEFRDYALRYYPHIVEKEGSVGIPDFLLNFSFWKRGREDLREYGAILFRFSDQVVSEIHMQFYPD